MLALVWPSARVTARVRVRQHHASNDEAMAHRRHPVRFVLSVLQANWKVAAATFAVCTTAAYGGAAFVGDATLISMLGGSVSQGANQGDASSALAVLRDVNVALLSAQATLLGLVYPIVIALVSVLLGARSTGGARMLIFVRQTGAIQVGASALSLCGTATVALAFATSLPISIIVGFTAVNLVWFLGNLLGIGLFLKSTLAFLTPAGRQALRHAYACNVAWPREFEQLLVPTIVTQVGREVNTAAISPASPLVEVAAGRAAGHGKGGAVVRHLPGTPHIVRDVRVALLDLVAGSWADRQRRDLAAGANLLHSPERRSVSFPLLPGDAVQGPVTLATWTADAELTRVERLLVRLSFSIERDSGDWATPPSSRDLLSDAANEMMAATLAGDSMELRVRLAEAADLHGLLLRLAAMQGNSGSYADQPGRRSFATLGQEWGECYRDALERVAEVSLSRPELLQVAAYLPTRIAAAAGRVPLSSLSASDALLPLLANFVSMRLRRAPGGGPAVLASPQVLPAPDVQSAAWRTMIGAWNYLLLERMRTAPVVDGEDEWQRLVGGWSSINAHLQGTARMAARAASLGDIEGVRWAIDALLRWPDELSKATGYNPPLPPMYRRVSTSLIEERDWKKVRDTLAPDGFSLGITPGAAFGAAAEEAWALVLIALAEVLLSWASQKGREDPSIIGARMLFRHELHDTAAHSRLSKRPFGSGLGGTLRATLDASRDGLEGVASALARQAPQDMVSMRIYMSSGPASDLSAAEALLLVAAASRAVGQPGEAAATAVPSTAGEAQTARHTIQDLDRLARNLHALNAAEWSPIAAALTSDDPAGSATPVDFDEWRGRAVARLQELRQQVASNLETALTSLPLDQVRLQTTADDAARAAFASGMARCPVNLFDRVETASFTPAHSAEISFQGYSRGEFTSPRLVEAKSDWGLLPGALADRAAWGVGSALLDQSTPVVQVANAETWCDAVTSAVDGIGEPPHEVLILVSQSNSLIWLNGWKHGYGAPVPAGLSVAVRQDEARQGYFLDLNGIPLFHALLPSDWTIVVSRRALAAVQFTVSGSHLATAEFVAEPSAEDGTLIMRFGFRVALSGPAPVSIKYTLRDDGGLPDQNEL
ncbi:MULTISPECIES: hypothetical protein [Roseomonadaceae]|uniref:Uncharacterized protein n=1 Tax=Falsiroseomonas oleicola TaxID=2801474 RepID=A0ABS6HFR1_9PROT|nr:hypothetical protein [Roseomonas oleicola]MBU8546130.1 hypothetical protein [Roseomonas oleicola]